MRDADIILELRNLNNVSILAGPDEVEVITISKTLEELGITLHDDLKYLTLIPVSAGIFWADGEATVGVNPFPSQGAEIRITKSTGSTREFIVASNTITKICAIGCFL